MFEKISTQNVRKKIDPRSKKIRPKFEKISAQNVRQIFGPSSNSFRPEMIEKFPTLIIRKNFDPE